MFGGSEIRSKNDGRRFESEDWELTRTDNSVRSIFTSGSSFRRMPPSRHIPEPSSFRDSPRPPRLQRSLSANPEEEEPLGKLLDFQSEPSKQQPQQLLQQQQPQQSQPQQPKKEYDEFMSAIDVHLQHIPVQCCSPGELSLQETPQKRGANDDTHMEPMFQEKDNNSFNEISMVFEGVGKWEQQDEEKAFPSRSYSEGLVPSGTPKTWDGTSSGSEGGLSGIATELRDEYTIGSLTREIRIEEDDTLVHEEETFLPVEEEIKEIKQEINSIWCEAIYCGTILLLMVGIAVGVTAIAGGFSSPPSPAQITADKGAPPMAPTTSPRPSSIPTIPTFSMPTEAPALLKTEEPITGLPSQLLERFPSLSPLPQPAEVPITVVIQTDQYAGDTGWSLVCDDSLLAEVPQNSYAKDVDRIVETFKVNDGARCTFDISDKNGDGLCCEYGVGFYRVYYGEDISETGEILIGGGQFGSEEKMTFRASLETGSLAPVPSISTPPTVFPSQVPSLSNVQPETAAPTGGSMLSIIFQFDQYPLEIGWTLQCNNDTIADVPAYTYKIPESSVSQSFPVDAGSMCQLVVTDNSHDGDGLCCNFGIGYYQVYYMDEDYKSSLVLQGAAFRFKAITDFKAASPPPAYVIITVAIQMDLFADEIYWNLQCNDAYLADFTDGTYTEKDDSFVLFTRTYSVQQGSQCRLKIMDSYGDGLCCSEGAGVGNYKVYYGPNITDENMIIVQGSEFAHEEETIFAVNPPLL